MHSGLKHWSSGRDSSAYQDTNTGCFQQCPKGFAAFYMHMVIIYELKQVLILKQQTPLNPVLMPHQKGIHSSFPRNRCNQYTTVFSLRPVLIWWAVIKFHARKRPASTPKNNQNQIKIWQVKLLSSAALTWASTWPALLIMLEAEWCLP